MSFWSYAFVVSLRFLYVLVYPFLFFISKSKRLSVPPSNDDLLKISATKLSELIRQKKLSSEKVIQAYIKRIKEVNPIVNAIVQDRFEDALKEAKSVDDYLRTTSVTENELKATKPLLGVPVTVKETCKLSGMSYTAGSLEREGMKADTDGDAVGRLKMSGAIPLLVSSTPELAISLNCYNKIVGTTCNPYDVTRNSGGSSGGEAALLGSGASLIGIGSDLAGSIRYPAMCCGVYGHKPTSNIVPIKGHFPLPPGETFTNYITLGPMCRYAEDLKLLMNILSGEKSVDLRLNDKVDLSKLRVYNLEQIPTTFINPSVQVEIKDAIKQGVKYLSEHCKTKAIKERMFEKELINSFEYCIGLIMQMQPPPGVLQVDSGGFSMELVKCMFGKSKFTFDCIVAAASMMGLQDFIYKKEYEDMKDELKKKLGDELGDDGVLLIPTYPCGALKHAESLYKFPHAIYLIPFSLIGFPSTQVPCGRTPDGLPIGLQVVAGPKQDRLCFAVAEELERCFGGWKPTNHVTK